MAVVRKRNAVSKDAAEIARTPVPNPYRGQLSDPYSDRPITTTPGASAASPANAAPIYRTRTATPRAVTYAGVIGIVLGCLIALYGLMLLAILSFQHELGAPDRSFQRGLDGSYTVLSILDFLLAVVFISGGIGVLGARVVGRIALTIGGWISLMLSFFWWHSDHVVDFVPVVSGIASASMLIALYLPGVSRWLGVQPPPQPF